MQTVPKHSSVLATVSHWVTAKVQLRTAKLNIFFPGRTVTQDSLTQAFTSYRNPIKTKQDATQGSKD